MALAPLGVALFSRVLRHDPTEPTLAGPRPVRAVVRARVDPPVLAAAPERLRPRRSTSSGGFRELGSITPGHPENRLTPGVEVTTGPARPGVLRTPSAWRSPSGSCATPSARSSSTTARGSSRATATSMEGVSHESASLAGHLGLGRLCVVYDDNHITIDGIDGPRAQRRRRGAVPRLRLGRPRARRGGERPRRADRRAARRDAGHRPPDAARPALAHRVPRRPTMDRHPRGARHARSPPRSSRPPRAPRAARRRAVLRPAPRSRDAVRRVARRRCATQRAELERALRRRRPTRAALLDRLLPGGHGAPPRTDARRVPRRRAAVATRSAAATLLVEARDAATPGCSQARRT